MKSAADQLLEIARGMKDSESQPASSATSAMAEASNAAFAFTTPIPRAVKTSMISVKVEEYPQFSNGDVLIILPNGVTWKFHSFHLSNASSGFREILQNTVPIHLTKKEQLEQSKSVRWILKMEVDLTDERFVIFNPTKPNAKANAGSLLGNTSHEPRYLNIYDNFFKCIYNIDPEFGNGDISELVYRTFSLLQAAETLHAVPSVRRPIESHLLRANQLLWKQVRDKPEGWADIAIRLQSPVIFREAMIHLTGRWNLPNMIDEAHLKNTDNGEKIKEIVLEKIRETNLTKIDIENDLLTFYPMVMQHPSVNGGNANRSAYTNDIYLWQSLTIVRQYIMYAISQNMHHMAPDGGALFYRQIGDGNAAYLTSHVLEDFHELFSMSMKGKECLSVAVHFVKEQLRPLVAELLENRLQILSGAKEFNYLTCFLFSDKELPWYKKTATDTREETDGRGDWEDDDSSMDNADLKPASEFDEDYSEIIAITQEFLRRGGDHVE